MHIVLSAGKREEKEVSKGISGIGQLKPKQQKDGANPMGFQAWPVSSLERWSYYVLPKL